MYQIVYHKLVLKEDFKRIPKGDQKRIFRDIYKKLISGPSIFGKPLTDNLKGYFRLRIGQYRVIYRIEKQKIVVVVAHVGLRKDFAAYFESARRLGL
ncbi:MAG: type II toxin-antitoxin system RelE/ParE family toxin [Patescibacteria group bacterium]